MAKSEKISLADKFSTLKYLENRTPELTGEDDGKAFLQLSDYRDGGVYIAHYAGNSEWERHPGDELVHVIEGETTLFLFQNNTEKGHKLVGGQLLVVPEGIWHRFESPKGVKILTVTPQPTEHSLTVPSQN